MGWTAQISKLEDHLLGVVYDRGNIPKEIWIFVRCARYRTGRRKLRLSTDGLGGERTSKRTKFGCTTVKTPDEDGDLVQGSSR
jgi:hypothetical protein